MVPDDRPVASFPIKLFFFVNLMWVFVMQVNVPKTKKTYSKNKECKKHTPMYTIYFFFAVVFYGL
jgi:archaellum biogenesis protein FlaJ (TadC family)